jgi:hypothetical protein
MAIKLFCIARNLKPQIEDSRIAKKGFSSFFEIADHVDIIFDQVLRISPGLFLP